MILTIPVDRELYPSLGGAVCDWIEDNLVFGPGDLRGQPARLDEDKRGLIWRMYEVYPKGHALEGRRRFKRAGISLPKGLAKTEMAAWIAAAELHHKAPVRCVGWEYNRKTKQWEPVGGPVTDPYIPMLAYTEEQSDELAYGALRVILDASPIASHFDIGLERIIRKTGDGKAVSLSSSPNARDGARTTFAVCDETHWWTLPRLKQAHQTTLNNLPKRRAADAWMLEITTAPEPGTGSVAEATMDYAKAVEAGAVKDSTLFYYHRQASDEHDLTTPEGARAAVIEASGPAAVWRDIDAIVGLRMDPTVDAAFWERVWTNRLVQGELQAFDVEQFKALKVKAPHAIKRGALITIGFDGSQFNDSTGLVATEIETGYQWVAGAWERPTTIRPEPWQVPADEVDTAVRALFREFTVWRMYADPYWWQTYLALWEGLFGKERVIKWATTQRNKMATALENYDTAIKEQRLQHDGDARLVRHVGNARRHNIPGWMSEQGTPLWLIQKERSDSPHKIDIAMAAVLSWQARTDAIASGVRKRSVGVMVV